MEEQKQIQDQKNVKTDTSVDDLVMEHECISLWGKCIELLVGYCPLLEVGDDESHIPYGVLHAVTCCKVPNPSLVQIALIVFPEQAWQRDEQGMIPLHHVLCGNHKYATTALLDILLSSDVPSTTKTVLIEFPNNGPTPLAFALKRGLPVDGVIQKLLDADSDVTLHIVDPSTRLYPFCLAALSKNGNDFDRHDLDANDTSNDDSCDNQEVELSDVGTEDSNSDHSINTEESLYELDVIYRLLLAHPQVLSQL